MKLTLLVVGKTDENFVKEGIDRFAKRLSHYIDFNLEVIPDIKKTKNMNPGIQKIKEGELILNKQAPSQEIHLFDEKGKMYSSPEFALFLQKKWPAG